MMQADIEQIITDGWRNGKSAAEIAEAILGESSEVRSARDLAEELREYTAMKYAGDCKCGKCQLVPRALVERIYHTLNSTPSPAQAAPDCGDDENRMEKISALIARLQSTLDRWGDTCVYIRRGGLSWGAVALNRRSDDEKHGVFDLQAQHDRDMLERLGQVERLKKDRDDWRQKVWDAEAKASSVPSADHRSCHDHPTRRCTPDDCCRSVTSTKFESGV